jgi:hypothetical protein
MPSICRLRLNPETRTDTRDIVTGANKVRALKTGWWRQDGSKLAAHLAVIETSLLRVRNGIFKGRDRAPKSAYLPKILRQRPG